MTVQINLAWSSLDPFQIKRYVAFADSTGIVKQTSCGTRCVGARQGGELLASYVPFAYWGSMRDYAALPYAARNRNQMQIYSQVKGNQTSYSLMSFVRINNKNCNHLHRSVHLFQRASM